MPRKLVAGDIPVHPQADELDYEGEIAMVIGTDAEKLVDMDDLLEYILGVTVGNESSSQYWQKISQS